MTIKVERSRVTVYRFTDDGDLVRAGAETPATRGENLVSLFDFISSSREPKYTPLQVVRARQTFLRDNR